MRRGRRHGLAGPFLIALVACAGCSGDDPVGPAAPVPVTLQQPLPEDIDKTSIRLTWTSSLSADFAFYAVIMEDSTDVILLGIPDRNETSYTVRDLNPGTRYSFRIDVVTLSNAVARGNSVSVTTEALLLDQSTPDLTMQNFVNAWETLSIAEYSLLIHDDFQFFFDPADDLAPFIGGESWGRTPEIDFVTAVFSSQPGQDPVTEQDVLPVEGIRFIAITKLDPAWQELPSDPLYDGTLRMRYQIWVEVNHPELGESITYPAKN